MADWGICHKDAEGRDTQSTHPSKEAAIVQALHLERRQHCRIQVYPGAEWRLDRQRDI